MNVEEDLTPEQIDNLSIHYVKTIEEALRVSLPVVAEALAAKVILAPPAKDAKLEHPIQAPVVRDKVLTTGQA